MLLPVFLQQRHIKEIEQYLLEGNDTLDYSNCEGIDSDIYDEFKQMLINHQEQYGKIKEKGVSKQLKKIIRKLEYRDRF